MLKYIENKTLEYLNGMPKNLRKSKGQFFTSLMTAKYMAEMFNISQCNNQISVLDPGAGTGILAVAFVEYVSRNFSNKTIFLTCYETDTTVLPILKDNLAYIKNILGNKFDYSILECDYILSQNFVPETSESITDSLKQYDFVISNPPYLKIGRNDPAARAMDKVVHGAPNLYFLFASMSLFNLKHNGEMVYIIPRSWSSGAYFKAFRRYLLTEGKIEQLHLFASRDKVFDAEQVLQETMIIKVKKTTKNPEFVKISSTNSCDDFDNVRTLYAPYNVVVSGEDLYVYLPIDEKDIKTIQTINTYHSTLKDSGLKMKTGIVVDFRQEEELRKSPGEHIFPLFYSQHIRNGRVNHQPSGKEFDWIIDSKSSLIQKNKNYVFIKRFTSKEESRRLQCGVFSPSDFGEYEYIGTQNKINFVDMIDDSEMDYPTTYGVYALLNSTLFDSYYRILNGSTQVNSTEVNNMPFPPANIIKIIGEKVIVSDDLSTDNCDRIIAEVAYDTHD